MLIFKPPYIGNIQTIIIQVLCRNFMDLLVRKWTIFFLLSCFVYLKAVINIGDKGREKRVHDCIGLFSENDTMWLIVGLDVTKCVGWNYMFIYQVSLNRQYLYLSYLHNSCTMIKLMYFAQWKTQCVLTDRIRLD